MLLRGAVGLVALIEGAFYITGGSAVAPVLWCAGVLGLVAGGALLIGVLTPLSGVVVGLGALGIGFSIVPAPTPNLFDARLSAIFAGIMTVAIVFLGPGAFSLDAHLFGRREIIIPQAVRPPRA
jgi:uncharacterized membrane protein YphA (DoxX/SURF4 family)